MIVSLHIDGKTNRRSGNKNKTLKPLHNVTAFATGMSLALGQVHVDEKSNKASIKSKILKAARNTDYLENVLGI